MAGIGEGKLAQKAKRQGVIGYAIDYWKEKASKAKQSVTATPVEEQKMVNRNARRILDQVE